MRPPTVLVVDVGVIVVRCECGEETRSRLLATDCLVDPHLDEAEIG